jgi:aerobic-type carbon monoxide dehydrogenase small subunit (CoxS/CutS family)
MPYYSLMINGTIHDVEAPADMSLLSVMRDLLGITGPKYGCGIGACGTCVCHVDGVATRVCVLPVSSVGNASITTIEGLSVDGELHPVQQAWIDEDVAQCGFCQPGQIMTAVKLLENNPNPSDEEIDEAMSNNVCRCGSYMRIRAAIKRVAENR